MRVTNKLIFDTVINNMLRSSENLLKDHSELSSGKKIQRPSDDPIGFSQVLRYKDSISKNNQYLRNIDNGISFLEMSDSILSTVDNLLIHSKELAVAMSNDTVTSGDRADTANEIDNIFNELVQIGNAKLGNKYIFGGFLNNTAPFDSVGAYNGDNNSINIDINPNVRIAMNIPGDTVFKATGGSTIDIFKVLSDFKTALNNNDTTNIRSAINNIDTALTQITNNRAVIGSRINRMESTKNSLEDYNLNMEALRSNKEDADITKTVSNMVLHQTILEASQASASKVISSSLLNFLR
ncbi:MAG: flagellar hook-associated protein FlgL [Nitrospirota bacterium]